MKVLSFGLLLVLCSAALRAEDLAIPTNKREHSHASRRVWIRRITLAAGCAASLALDSWSTHRALEAGGVESNPLLQNSQGQTNWGRMFALKAAGCGSMAVLEETGTFHAWRSPNADWTWTGINAATIAGYTAVAVHNLGIANQLSK